MRIVELNFDIIYNYFIDIVFVLFLFRKLKTQNKINILKKFLGGTALSLILFVYITALIHGKSRFVLLLDGALRAFWRGLMITVFLLTVKQTDLKKSIYFALYSLILINTYMIITSLVNMYMISNEDLIETLIFRHICMAVVLITADKIVDIVKIKRIGFTRMASMIFGVACLVYIKGSMRFVSRVMRHSTTFQYFLIMLIAFIFITVLITECNLISGEELEELRLQNIAENYQMKHICEQQKHNENIRTLAHDMKNHLIAIRKMSLNKDNERINIYIDDMIQEFGLNYSSVNTGNKLVDSIISEKMKDAEKFEIMYSVLLDARPLSFISDMDLCILFGNALDNAFEACHSVDKKARRYISIKSGMVANQIVIEISNSCNGKIKFFNELPDTTKSDKERHGFGLKSIKRTAEKYNGIIKISTDEANVYKLTIMIPEKI